MQKIYLVRHCETVSQEPKSSLTEKGYEEAVRLADFFAQKNIDSIISSPYRRARESIEPFAQEEDIDIIEDERLTERILSSENLTDWYEKLRETFVDKNLTFPGGESSKEAMIRIVEVIEELISSDYKNTIVVTHGNILALLLHHYDCRFGFEDWEKLRNPDVFLLELDGDIVRNRRIW